MWEIFIRKNKTRKINSFFFLHFSFVPPFFYLLILPLPDTLLSAFISRACFILFEFIISLSQSDRQFFFSLNVAIILDRPYVLSCLVRQSCKLPAKQTKPLGCICRHFRFTADDCFVFNPPAYRPQRKWKRIKTGRLSMYICMDIKTSSMSNWADFCSAL